MRSYTTEEALYERQSGFLEGFPDDCFDRGLAHCLGNLTPEQQEAVQTYYLINPDGTVVEPYPEDVFEYSNGVRKADPALVSRAEAAFEQILDELVEEHQFYKREDVTYLLDNDYRADWQ